jgi:hypothetical protein
MRVSRYDRGRHLDEGLGVRAKSVMDRGSARRMRRLDLPPEDLRLRTRPAECG